MTNLLIGINFSFGSLFIHLFDLSNILSLTQRPYYFAAICGFVDNFTKVIWLMVFFLGYGHLLGILLV